MNIEAPLLSQGSGVRERKASGDEYSNHSSRSGRAKSWDNHMTERGIIAASFPALDPSKLSDKALCCNMVLSIIGTTVLGITAQMKAGGWIVTPLLLILGCAIVSELTFLVSSTIDKLQEEGHEVLAYGDYIEGAIGPRARSVSTVTSALALLGMICNGFILESKNLAFSIPIEWPWFTPTEHASRNWWALILSSTTLIYCFVDAASLLKKSAVIGPFVCLGCIVLAWVGTGDAVQSQSHFPETCLNSDTFEYWSFWPGASSGDTSLFGILISITGIASYGFYCFAVVITVPSLKHEMQDPSKLTKAAISAYTICTILFLSIMMIGYWGFGNLTPESLIDGMRTHRPVGWWAETRPWETGHGTLAGNAFSWMIIANLLLTDAIYVPCTVINLENAAPSFFEGKSCRKVTLRLFVVLFRLGVATYVDSFIALTNLTSALFCVATNILFPIIAFHSRQVREVSSMRKAIHGFIFAFGCVVMVVGSYGALVAIIHPSDASTVAPGEYPRLGISESCKALYILANSTQS